MKTIKSALGTAALVAMTLAMPAHADGPVGSGPNPYSDCGIGAALFKDTDWAAVTSNVIWDLGTTAVTSATMSPETCQGRAAVAAKFIIDNYDDLSEDVARGEGEHLAAIYNVVGCSAEAQNVVTGELRQAMSQQVAAPAFAEQSLNEKAEAMYFAVADATQACAS